MCVRSICVAALLAGCAAAAAPARLQTPAPACLAQIGAFVEQRTGNPARLDAGAFAQTDTLRLQPALIRDAQGQPLDGRSLGRPETFRLRAAGGVCTVEHVQSDVRAVLEACHCRALDG